MLTLTKYIYVIPTQNVTHLRCVSEYYDVTLT